MVVSLFSGSVAIYRTHCSNMPVWAPFSFLWFMVVIPPLPISFLLPFVLRSTFSDLLTSALKIEAVCPSGTLVPMYQNTQCHDSEDGCSKFLWNIGIHVPQYTITQKIAAVSSYVMLVPMYQHRPT